MKCRICKQNYKSLTKKEVCAFCFKKQYGYWADEFCSEEERERRTKGGVRT